MPCGHWSESLLFQTYGLEKQQKLAQSFKPLNSHGGPRGSSWLLVLGWLRSGLCCHLESKLAERRPPSLCVSPSCSVKSTFQIDLKKFLKKQIYTIIKYYLLVRWPTELHLLKVRGIFKKVCIFILFETEMEWMHGQSLAHSPGSQNSQDWARMKPGVLSQECRWAN